MRKIFDTADLVLSPDVPSTTQQSLIRNLFSVDSIMANLTPRPEDENFGMSKGRSLVFSFATGGAANQNKSMSVYAPALPFWRQGYFPTQQAADDFPRNKALIGWDFLLSMQNGAIDQVREISFGVNVVWQNARMWYDGATKYRDTLITLRFIRTATATTWTQRLEIVDTTGGATATYTLADYRRIGGSSDLRTITGLYSTLYEDNTLRNFPNPDTNPMLFNQVLLEFELPNLIATGPTNTNFNYDLQPGRLTAIIVNGTRQTLYKQQGSSAIEYLPEKPHPYFFAAATFSGKYISNPTLYGANGLYGGYGNFRNFFTRPFAGA